MQDALPTDVPPNLITRRGLLIRVAEAVLAGRR